MSTTFKERINANPRTGRFAQPAGEAELRAAMDSIHGLIWNLDELPLVLRAGRIKSAQRLASIAMRGEEYYK